MTPNPTTTGDSTVPNRRGRRQKEQKKLREKERKRKERGENALYIISPEQVCLASQVRTAVVHTP